jgi:hypothetical protein
MTPFEVALATQLNTKPDLTKLEVSPQTATEQIFLAPISVDKLQESINQTRNDTIAQGYPFGRSPFGTHVSQRRVGPLSNRMVKQACEDQGYGQYISHANYEDFVTCDTEGASFQITKTDICQRNYGDGTTYVWDSRNNVRGCYSPYRN